LLFVSDVLPMLRIALPNKGRLSDDVRELFDDAGLPVLVAGDRALAASLGGEFEAIFVRAQDIPEFVADGAADAGVTGWDLVCESGRPLDDLLDLELGTLGNLRAGLAILTPLIGSLTGLLIGTGS
jgi:ATP phosphoribosyltransferase